jgi:hypothetical protein
MVRQIAKLAPLILLSFWLGMVWVNTMAATTTPENPIQSVLVTIGDNAQEDLLGQLKKFADANAFAIRVGHTRPDGKHILVQMWREDIKVIVVNPSEAGTFRISFYQNSAEPVMATSIDTLMTDLRNDIAEIKGVRFSER